MYISGEYNDVDIEPGWDECCELEMEVTQYV
jgi:hypothetical protein